MKKLFQMLSFVLMFLALGWSQAAQATIYWVGGNENWTPVPTTEFTTADEETYTYECNVSGTIWFAIADGQGANANDWSTFNSQYRYSLGTKDAPVEVGQEYELKKAGDYSMKFTGEGKYRFTFVLSTAKLSIEKLSDELPDAEITSVTLASGANGWSTTDNPFTAVEAGKKYSIVFDLTSTTEDVEFKLVVNGDKWIGTNQLTLTAPENWIVPAKDGDGQNFKLMNSATGYQTYTLTAEWAGGKVADAGWSLTVEGKDQRATVEEQEFTVKFVNGKNWEKVFAYTWGGEGETFAENAEWPGVELTQKDSVAINDVKYAVYTYTFRAAAAPEKIIFNNGITEGEGKDQTADLAFENGKQYEETVPEPIIVVEPKYVVAGTFNEWNAAEAPEMTKGDDGKYTFVVKDLELAKDSVIELKVVNIAEEDQNKWTWYPEVDNFTFTATEDGTYALTVIFDPENGAVTVDASKKEEPIELTEFTVKFVNGANWEKVFAYTWSGKDEAFKQNAEWPGVELSVSDSVAINDVKYAVYTYTFKSEAAPEKVIFNNGITEGEGKAQTDDLLFENGKQYEVTVPEPVIVVEPKYVVAGTFNEWKAAEAPEMTKGEDGKYTFMIKDLELKKDSVIELKVVNIAEEDQSKWTWYPEVDNFTFTATEDGTYALTVIFDPENGAVTVDASKKEEPIELTEFTVKFVNGANWEKVFAYTWSGKDEAFKQNAEWPGVELSVSDSVAINDVKYAVYTYTFKSEAAPEKVIFNNGITEGEGKDQTADLAFENGKQYEETVPEPIIVVEPKYVVAGTFNEWNAAEAPEMTKGDDGKYTFVVKDLELAKDSVIELKVVNIAEEDQNKWAWYPAENYKFTAAEAGIYDLTVTFDPEAEAPVAVEGKKTADIEPVLTEFTVKFVNGKNWEKVFAYTWGGEGETFAENAVWPGVELTQKTTTTINSVTYDLYTYTFKAETAPAMIIFNNGITEGEDKAQTADLIFENGKQYEDTVTDVPTSITAIASGKMQGTTYSLSGQRVTKAKKGLYIVNGKKVLVK